MSPAVAILIVLLCSIAFGAAMVIGAQALMRRFGRRGVFAGWLVATMVLAGVMAGWFVLEMWRVGPLWGAFLTPFLFQAITLGVVATYVARSRASRGRQRVIALLLYLAALVPAGFLAILPDRLYYNSFPTFPPPSSRDR
jgi:uncharacterized membrane protein